jgi:hypothetical protein
MALTYSQLVTQIRNYTEVDSNGLSDSTVSVIVQNTENRIYRELNIDAFRLYASAADNCWNNYYFCTIRTS